MPYHRSAILQRIKSRWDTYLRVRPSTVGGLLLILTGMALVPSARAQVPADDWVKSVTVQDDFGENKQGEAPYSNYDIDLYEDVDYDDEKAEWADIKSFSTGYDESYYYFEFELARGWRDEAKGHAVAVEMDYDSDQEFSRGDYLIFLKMDEKFSDNEEWVDAKKAAGFKFFEDANDDVGGRDPLESDYDSGDEGDGYKRGLPEKGKRLWGRITGDGRFQVAFRRDELPDTDLLLSRGWIFQGGEPSEDKFYFHDHNKDEDVEKVDNIASSDTGTWPPMMPPTVPEADVSVELSVDDDIPQVDQEFIYTVQVNHLSGGTAAATVIEFLIPEELDYVGHSASSGTYDESTGEWTVGDMTSNQQESLDVTVTAAIDQLGELIPAEAQLLEGDFVDTNPDNNFDEIEVRIAGHDGSVAWVTDLTGSTVQEFASPGSNVHVRVIDEDLNQDPGEAETVLVRLRSQSANDEEIITLTEISADSDTFTGVIATSTDPVDVADGELQVQPGDTGEATYSDDIDSEGNVGVLREAFIEFEQPQLVLNLTVDKFEAEPGEEITYIVSYVNLGQLPGANVLVQQNIPRYTTYVAESMRIGLASDTYDTAFALTDVDDGVEGTVNGAQVGGVLSDRVEVSISSVAADDGNQGGGPNQGRVFFKVTIDE